MNKFITCESKNNDNPGVRYIGRFDFSEVQARSMLDFMVGVFQQNLSLLATIIFL